MGKDQKIIGYDIEKIKPLLINLRDAQEEFKRKFNVSDIFTNSKIYEILIADSHNHDALPGHGGTKDAKDASSGFIYEYKHYKKSSSNHTWTFNDYSDNTLKQLEQSDVKVIFAYIDDNGHIPKYDWFYEVDGKVIADYIRKKDTELQNKRKMINISSNQLESLGAAKKNAPKINGKYNDILEKIFNTIKQIEILTNSKNLLTSNKLWELVVALGINHKINSNQGGKFGKHDSVYDGKTYEYKVSGGNERWSFVDISDEVLDGYLQNDKIILAIVDKTNIKLSKAYAVEPKEIVKLLKSKRTTSKNRLIANITINEVNVKTIFEAEEKARF